MDVDDVMTDSKGIMANERTFQDWIHMSVNLGFVGSAMLSLSAAKKGEQDQIMSNNIAFFVGAVLTPIGIFFACYATLQYFRRRKVLNTTRDQALGDLAGPMALGCVLLCALIAIFLEDLLGNTMTSLKPHHTS